MHDQDPLLFFMKNSRPVILPLFSLCFHNVPCSHSSVIKLPYMFSLPCGKLEQTSVSEFQGSYGVRERSHERLFFSLLYYKLHCKEASIKNELNKLEKIIKLDDILGNIQILEDSSGCQT